MASFATLRRVRGARLVKVSFNFDNPHYGKTYPYLTILEDLELGQVVVVEAMDRETQKVGLSTAIIVEVLGNKDIPDNPPYQLRWALSTKGAEAIEAQLRIAGLIEVAQMTD